MYLSRCMCANMFVCVCLCVCVFMHLDASGGIWKTDHIKRGSLSNGM